MLDHDSGILPVMLVLLMILHVSRPASKTWESAAIGAVDAEPASILQCMAAGPWRGRRLEHTCTCGGVGAHIWFTLKLPDA
jgi:hypothetical protein